ncbi:MAG: PilN domain-containing protein [Thermoanaerobaculia bacterium]
MPRPALNLARRPFLNRRPVLRAALLLAAAAGVVLLLDAVLYGRSLMDLRALGAREDEIHHWLQDEQRKFDAVRATPEFRGLAEYNRTVYQLNALIAERTFPWGRLFDQLSAVLPPGVRLQRLAPAQEGPGQRRRGAEADAEAAGDRVVLLSVDGVARSDEELYAFVDALFAAGAFRNPVLTQESQEAVGRTFTVQVQYLITPRRPGDQGSGVRDQGEEVKARETIAERRAGALTPDPSPPTPGRGEGRGT